MFLLRGALISSLVVLASIGFASTILPIPSDLAVEVPAGSAAAMLSDWTWLVGQNKAVLAITPCGDAFLEEQASHAIYFLDVEAAQIDQVAASRSEFRELLAKPAFINENFCPDAVEDMRQQGKPLKVGQVYSLKVPMVLGGHFRADNLEPTNAQVHFHVLGQIQKQVKDLPPGTAINSIKIR